MRAPFYEAALDLRSKEITIINIRTNTKTMVYIGKDLGESVRGAFPDVSLIGCEFRIFAIWKRGILILPLLGDQNRRFIELPLIRSCSTRKSGAGGLQR